VARRLVECTGHPVTSTSANLTGDPAAQTAEQVVRRFGDWLAVVLDGGSRRSTAPSTLLDLTGPEPRILREGPISRERIERILESS
jgi:tRNA A37 threonylcarbamoyladenosine synthetase subunit TsaC/SUA5/YrdC